MAAVDSTTLTSISEAPATETPDDKPEMDVPEQSDPTGSRQSQQSQPMDHMESAASREIAKMGSSPSQTSVESIRQMTSSKCGAFHIPVLARFGRPNAGKVALRTRPLLVGCNPQKRKRFTLAIYAMLSGQVLAAAVVAAAVTALILVPGGLPEDLLGTTPYWVPQFPLNVLMVVCPVWFCTFLCFIALSCLRGLKTTSRVLLVVCTLATGISLGLLTYLDKSFAMIFIGIVLMSLVVHTLGISVNLSSSLATKFGIVKPQASKMEMMGRGSYLTGTEKFICMLYDEDAVYTRASFALAGLSWIAASLTALVIVAIIDFDTPVTFRDFVPLVLAAPAAGVFIAYFTYGVEKQVRRCKPHEKERAMINLSVDLLFFVAEGLTIDMSILKWQELGSAAPVPVVKGSFQYAMKQVSSASTFSTTFSSFSKGTATTASTMPRVTVAV